MIQKEWLSWKEEKGACTQGINSEPLNDSHS